MATDRVILRLGRNEQGLPLSSGEFAASDFDEPWRYERENGRLVVMAPAGDEHASISEPWRDRLGAYRLNHPELVDRVVSEAWIRVDEGTDRIADMAVYRVREGSVAPIPDRVPELVFEVVSPDRTSRDRDYVVKRAEYHRLGVLEYVIVDRFLKTVTVLSFAPPGYRERILSIGDVYESPLLPGFSIRLSDVF